MGFVFSEHVYRHCAGCMQVQGFRRMDDRYHIPQRLIRYGVDIYVCLWQTDRFAVRPLCCRIRQRTGMNEFGLDAFGLKGVVQVRPYTPCAMNSYLHLPTSL